MNKLAKHKFKKESVLILLRRLYSHIDRRRRWQFGMLLILLLVSTLAEVVSIGSVIPFLGILSSPQAVFDHDLAQPIIHFLGLTEPKQLILPLAGAFACAVVISGGMRLLLLIAQTRLSFVTGHQLGASIYQKVLFQPYSVHASRNSSEVINGVYSKAAKVTSSVILPVLTLLSGVVMLSAVMITLLLVEPRTALTAFFGFGLIYAAIIGFTRKQLISDGERIAQQSSATIKSLQEGLGGIRDILIHGNQNTYCDAYRRVDYGLKRAQGNAVIITQSPRFLMEALGVLLMIFLAYMLAGHSEGLIGAIPILGSLALGAQRLLPVLQQAYQSWSTLRGNQASLRDTLELLDLPLPDHAVNGEVSPILFDEEIVLKQVSFRYNQGDHLILRDVDLVIPRGSRIGFVGATGSGKSTLVDLLMGLLEPTAGEMCVDGVVLNHGNLPEWQQHIAHVPQVVFLADSTIAENIAFGIPQRRLIWGEYTTRLVGLRLLKP
ncbi:ATP-binding cassette domain-containing protein [Thalassospira lucentensis]|uniref:ATP-binding cassette domain-containing protein n=1 Tax=Thalassospira lucentensis TaxID=168935 RepID=UPI00399D58BB